jgi:hypothetical protein
MGIFMNYYLNLNPFEMNIYLLVISLLSTVFSVGTIMYDKIPFNETKNLLIEYPNKILFIITCFPTTSISNIAYVDVDPLVLQIIRGTNIVINILFSYIINKQELNYKVVILIFINLISCVFPFIIQAFSKQKVKLGIYGLVLTVILLLITGIICSIRFKLKEFNKIDNLYSISLIYSIFKSMFLIFTLPIAYFITDTYIFDLDRFTRISGWALFGSVIYTILWVKHNASYLTLKPLDFGIINNLVLVSIVIILSLVKISVFHYYYLISFGLVTLSSTLILFCKKTQQLEFTEGELV